MSENETGTVCVDPAIAVPLLLGLIRLEFKPLFLCVSASVREIVFLRFEKSYRENKKRDHLNEALGRSPAGRNWQYFDIKTLHNVASKDAIGAISTLLT